MIATWMVYCSLCALGLAFAAGLAERVLLAGRGPVRLVWITAIAVSLIVPATAFRFARSSGAAGSVAAARGDAVAAQVPDALPGQSAPVAAATRAQANGRSWRAKLGIVMRELQTALERFNGPLALAWLGLSLAVALNFIGGMVTLAWLRRAWQRRTVLGVPVFVAERTGPAVVGAMSPAIVVPEWVLALEARQLALLLRHEEEHRRARDGQVLTAAHLGLIAMPWNVALWWQFVRLRVAVELDCDARVLKDADPRSYGDLLLEVARPRRRLGMIGATAFAERATQLERRIRVLARHRVGTSRAARSMAACIGLAAVTIAWVAPHPSAPVRAVAAPPAPIRAATPAQREVPAPAIARTLGADTLVAAVKKSTAINKSVGDPSARVDSSVTLAEASGHDSVAPPVAARTEVTPASCTQTSTDDEQPTVDSVFSLLFHGMTVTRDQEATACYILAELHKEQFAADQANAAAILAYRVRFITLQVQRDNALRALLTNDADRATLDARLAQGPAGGRGRSGGPAPDWSGGGRAGSGGARARWGFIGDSIIIASGARGRGGSAGDTTNLAVVLTRGGRETGGRGLDVSVIDMLAAVRSTPDATFHLLFDGIALTADQEASARAVIIKTEEEIRTQTTLLPNRLRVNQRTGLVSMEAVSASALLALFSDDGDRATLRSRIRNLP